MDEASKTWVVECYVPGVDDVAVQRAADATAGQIRRLGPAAAGVQYLGALLMAVDEVVLHAFRAESAEVVGRVSAAAGLRFDRIVESVEVLPLPLVQPERRPSEIPQSLLQPKEVSL